MVGEKAEKRAWKHAETHCRDLNCRAHGRMLRRIQRLVQALVATRALLVLTELALDVNSNEVIRLQETARDERGMGWERAHTMMCSTPRNCREHRNPWQRSRAEGTT